MLSQLVTIVSIMSNNITFNLFGIFRSKVRTLLLLNFFINPDKEFFTRQLERDIKKPASDISRELKKLAEIKLVTSRRLGNMILYKINKKSPFYHQFRDLTLKIYGLKELLKPIFVEENTVIVSFIYGSYAKGDFDATSDIDIFVLVEKDDNLYEKINTELSRLEVIIGREINMDYVTLEEYKMKIRTQNPYISDILKNSKIFIKGGENEL